MNNLYTYILLQTIKISISEMQPKDYSSNSYAKYEPMRTTVWEVHFDI